MGLLLDYYYRKECLAKNLNEEPQEIHLRFNTTLCGFKTVLHFFNQLNCKYNYDNLYR